ncbi:hypothetical protein [Rodentibacter caecimuris]|uniref:hypothetical protein n=1 Tax=Rodentibacter caecimuris TaxID=1796644 RepID=UPI00224991F5|nr:hypothetical protein [Rodentibacter heylii]MCX2960259.1 hypothetical protein [Rodentibacter heylii]
MKKFIGLLFFCISIQSNAHPIIAAYEASMTGYLTAAGLTQQEAQTEAGKMSAYAFSGAYGIDTSESKGCVRPSREGNNCHKITIGETIINYNSDGKLDFISKTNQTVSQLKSMAQLSKYSESDILKSLYKDSELGDLVFEETYNRDEFIDELMSYSTMEGGQDYALAPIWYASTGLYLYRTKLPINEEQYLYFNDFKSLYHRYWQHLENIEPYSEEKEGYLDLTDEYRALIYESYYRPVNLKSNDERIKPEYLQSITMPSALLLPIKHHIFELSKDDIANFIRQGKEISADENKSLDEGYEISFGSIDKQHYIRVEELNIPVTVVQSRLDLKTKQDIENQEDEPEVKFVHFSTQISTDKKEEYAVKEQDLANSFNNMKNEYFRSNSNSITKSNGSIVNIDTNRDLTVMDLSKVSSSENKSYSLGSFLSSKSSIEEYGHYKKSNSSAVKTDVIDINDNNKPAPPISSGISGTNTEGTGIDSGTGSHVETGSNVGINSEIVSGSQAGTISKPIEGTKTEITDGYQDPILPEVSGIEILQPLLNLKEELLSKLNFNLPAGSCQALNIDFFNTSISSDAHCQLAERIAPMLASIMLLIYYIIAFRIILSA